MSMILKAEDVPDDVFEKLKRYKKKHGLRWKGVIIRIVDLLEEQGRIPDEGDF